MPYVSFKVKKPVHSFRDLEVYQKTIGASVIAAKDLRPKLSRLKYPFIDGMTQCSMQIPLFLSEAHSIRFGDHARGILLLEQAMAGCNKMIVYLEQARGIYGHAVGVAGSFGDKSRKNFLTDGDLDLIEDLVKRYAETRTKIFRLEKAWQKFTPPR